MTGLGEALSAISDVVYGNPFAEPVPLRSLRLWVPGRPAPQGSKRTGAAGQLREASPYLASWRAAVKKAVYERYAEMGVEPATLPLFRGPVGVRITFCLDPRRRTDAEPDGDKLLRGVWDALTQARVWEDDGRVIDWSGSKRHAGEMGTGAEIHVWAVIP